MNVGGGMWWKTDVPHAAVPTLTSFFSLLCRAHGYPIQLPSCLITVLQWQDMTLYFTCCDKIRTIIRISIIMNCFKNLRMNVCLMERRFSSAAGISAEIRNRGDLEQKCSGEEESLPNSSDKRLVRTVGCPRTHPQEIPWTHPLLSPQVLSKFEINNNKILLIYEQRNYSPLHSPPRLLSFY